jgi:hypothetical protein
MKNCAKVEEIARQQETESEEGWVHFWRSHTFTIVSEKARDQPGFQQVYLLPSCNDNPSNPFLLDNSSYP